MFLSEQDSKSLTEYNSFVKARWKELNIYQPFPKVVETLQKQKEDLKVVSFLTGLATHYESAEDQILIQV